MAYWFANLPVLKFICHAWHFHESLALGLNQTLQRLAGHSVTLRSTSDDSDGQPSLKTATSIPRDSDNKEIQIIKMASSRYLQDKAQNNWTDSGKIRMVINVI